MKPTLALATVFATTAVAAFAQNPMEAFKGKVKEGLYAYKIDMDMGQMPGIPAALAKQTINIQNCVTKQDIESGQLGKRQEGKNASDCQVKDFRMSGNTASYRMVCGGESQMTADTLITFTSDGYRMNMKMAMNRGGRVVNMNQVAQAKYLGACTK